ncbi:hypothetical protein ACLMJK_009348 [Lecanora helva]
MEDATTAIFYATPFFSDLLHEHISAMVQWHPDTETQLKHLYYLLHLTEYTRESLPLVKTFLQGKDTKSLLHTQVCFSREINPVLNRTGDNTHAFKGSLIEVFAQSAILSEYPLEFLIEVGAGLFDPSIVLTLFIGGHHHARSAECNSSCPLQRLLKAGANPNKGDYQMTPLQIATVGRDSYGVECLLKAGALPNDTGNPNGVIWEEDTIMHHLSHLHGASPLKICREFKVFYQYDSSEGEDERKKIEDLLLQYGAEDFLTTCEPDYVEDEVDSTSLDY